MLHIKTTVYTLVFGLFISGCDGNDNISVNSDQYSGPLITEENKDTSISDIAGKWAFSVVNEGPDSEVWATNEFTVFIDENGDYVEYDYMGDSLAVKEETYGNCYIKQNISKIEKNIGGGFRLIYQLGGGSTMTTKTNYERQEENLIAAGSPFITDCKCSTPNVIAVPSPLTQSDIEGMLCE